MTRGNTGRTTPIPWGGVAGAILAANPHNTQPPVFHVTADSIDVLADTASAVQGLDPFGREQRVGLGGAIENLALACRARGLDPFIALLPEGPDADRVARVSLSAGSGSLANRAGNERPAPMPAAIARSWHEAPV